jgi:proteic killer suppression protein
MPVIRRVAITKRARKQLAMAPVHIRQNLMVRVAAIELEGLGEVRKAPGYHDEPLAGLRVGQRSVRLSRTWRAVYVIKRDVAELVVVTEISKHKY